MNVSIPLAVIIFAVSALSGSFAAIATTLINNYLQGRREEKQWQRQQELSAQSWQREKLLEIYMNCISSITAYLNSGQTMNFNSEQTVMPGLPIPGMYGVKYEAKFIGELEAWLSLLLICHSDNESPEFKALEVEVKLMKRDINQLRKIKHLATELGKTDTRLSLSRLTTAN